MIELRHDTLHLTSPATHEDATASIGFQQTLRIPDDGTDYPLPAGLGPFPLRHVDDHPDTVPESWTRHGGVMLPMWRTEAMWIRFDGVYPWAVKIAAGKRCAITGGEFSMDLRWRRDASASSSRCPSARATPSRSSCPGPRSGAASRSSPTP